MGGKIENEEDYERIAESIEELFCSEPESEEAANLMELVWMVRLYAVKASQIPEVCAYPAKN
jgi:antitoxin component HigA of HigAB toxin-antitoxin module